MKTKTNVRAGLRFAIREGGKTVGAGVVGGDPTTPPTPPATP